MSLELVAPELDDSAEVELTDNLVRLDERVHVCLKTMLRVHRFLVEFDFDEAVGISTDNEVDLSPIDHDHFLHVVDDIRQLLVVKRSMLLSCYAGLKSPCKSFWSASHLARRRSSSVAS